MNNSNTQTDNSRIRRLAYFGTLLFFTLETPMVAQEAIEPLQLRGADWREHADAANSLYRHIALDAYALLDEREAAVAKLETLSDWQERQAAIEATLMDIVGPFPEKTPLNARVTGTIEKDGYRVEHVVYESQPGFHVTASLFLPEMRDGARGPAVIYCSGHSGIGYRGRGYQRMILNLVMKGFIVFAFDPVGQGERVEYSFSDAENPLFRGPTGEHSYPGAQAFIAGSSQARHMIWDGIRAVDYVLTRPEVDPDRIGITGRSGGGTQSAYIAALDPRIRAAAPEAYITSFRRLFESVGPQDAEQNFYHGIASGIDHADLLILRAPKPTLVITTTNDFFSIQGARETVREATRVFRAYGKLEHLQMVEDIGGHQSTQLNREAMYAFFQEHLSHPGTREEEEVVFLESDELKVTATGRVDTSLGGETVFSLNRRNAARLLGRLEDAREDGAVHHRRVLRSAKELSGYIDPVETGSPVFTGRVQRDGYRIDAYFLEGVGDHVIPYLLAIPEKSNGRALLYIHPDGKAAEVSPSGEIAFFVKQGFTVLAPDLLGIGETGPGDFRGDAYIAGVSFNLWFGSVLTGRSIAGIRATDLVRLTRLLADRFPGVEIHALGRGELAGALLHAAAFEPLITRVALIETSVSYRALVMNRFYQPALIHGAVAGSLEAYDLPDLAGLLAPRKLLLSNPIDGTLENSDPAGLQSDLAVIRRAYERAGAREALHIGSNADSRADLLKWAGSVDRTRIR